MAFFLLLHIQKKLKRNKNLNIYGKERFYRGYDY